jgi:hypothetical protein
MNSNSSALIVPPPSTGGVAALAATNDIRGLKDPVEIPQGLSWLWGALLILAALIARRHFLRLLRTKIFGAKAARAPVIPPHVRAKQRLQAALAHIHDPRLFCFEVSETLRVYLEDRFSLRAPERTTEEFLVELQTSGALNQDQKQSLAEFLQSCDLVKFARFEPSETALRELHDSALRLVDETQFDPVSAMQQHQPVASR